MNAQEIAQKNKILEFRVGSYLYGTNTPESDEDYSGVFMPDEEQLFGFEKIEQVDLSVKSKRQDGKNDKDAVDLVLYELRKFVRLALDNNPNIIETLWCNKDNIIFSNEYGKRLLEHNYLFLHLGLKQKFLGYSYSQKRKMIIRTDNYHALENAEEWLNDYINDDVVKSKQLLVEILPKQLPFFTVKGSNINCGDLNFQKYFQLKKIRKMIADRLSKATNRKNLLTKYGYDTKFCSHYIRLMIEGKELLTTGKLEFPLKERQLILDIKLGKYKMVNALKIGEEYEKEIEDFAQNSKIPNKPRYDEIQKLTMNLIKDYYGFMT